MFDYRFGVVQFKNLIATSNPIKQAALAGNALIKTGTIPLYKPFGPSSFSKVRNASRKPPGYVPSGAKISHFYENINNYAYWLPVWILLLTTSAGNMKTQLIIPVSPPAVSVLIGVNPEPSAGAKAFFKTSYVIKYRPAWGIPRTKSN